VAAAVAAGADAVGLNLYPRSSRYVTLERAEQLARELPPFVTPVLVLVNASHEDVTRACAALPQALLQFHGDESPEDCDAAGRTYLRAVRMAPGVDLLDWVQRFPNAAAWLLDAPVEGYGGSGKRFDWSLVPSTVASHRLVLSGGLNPANVIDGVLALRPYAVDVSSGIEREKGVKDAALMRRFCEAVREADARLADLAT
jgi:phosphoribosylanthranilate isomerase